MLLVLLEILLTFNDNFTSIIVGNTNQYTNVATDAEDAIGQYAEFDISYASDSSNTYIIDAIENDGIQYAIGDKIKILGTALGGLTPANDATITVTSVASADSIASATLVDCRLIVTST